MALAADCGGALALFFLELYEFYLEEPLNLFEVALYAILVAVTGLFLEVYVRSNTAYKQALKILQFKHSLSQDLALSEDTEALIQTLTELPGKVIDVEETYLLMADSSLGPFDIVGHWKKDTQSDHQRWDPQFECPRCLDPTPSSNSTIHLCTGYAGDSSSSIYSLAVMNQHLPPAILKFKLASGVQLDSNVEDIFNNVSDEITVALQVNEARKRLSELEYAQVAIAERRAVSAYVHDKLGQNLGYLHMKLDQLYRSGIIGSENEQELVRMRDVANDSYEIVRDFLKKLQPETILNLVNLMKEHANKVSCSAHFSLDFKTFGTPAQLMPAFRHAIFYAFYEILNNVEKHSKADIVEVIVSWEKTCLDISVKDNGVGFDPNDERGEGHYGLEILKARIADLKGKLSIDSSMGRGTNISICVPIQRMDENPSG
jgi:signal transduction histidine kinase